MQRAGLKLKQTRERLKLTYREVAEASRLIAAEFGNPEFAIALSRLADIENKNMVPSIYRLYSLCAIYRLDFGDALGWYGAPLEEMARVALQTPLAETHLFQINTPPPKYPDPSPADPELDPGKTVFLSRLMRGLGSTPLRFLDRAETRRYRYGLIGTEDRSMYPILHPGSLVIIDDQARISSHWTYEADRPIYFFEQRDAYLCGWCDLTGDRLVVLPHPSSHQKPAVFQYPAEIDLVGQVVGVAALWKSPRNSTNKTAGK